MNSAASQKVQKYTERLLVNVCVLPRRALLQEWNDSVQRQHFGVHFPAVFGFLRDCIRHCWNRIIFGNPCTYSQNVIFADSFHSVSSTFFAHLYLHLEERSGFPISSVLPQGLHSGASEAGYHSPQQTPHWSKPEGWSASWKSFWLLQEDRNNDVFTTVLSLGTDRLLGKQIVLMEV